MVQQQCTEGRVDQGGGTGDQWCQSQGNHADGDGSFGGPMDRTVGLRWWGRNIGIVNITNNVTWGLGNGLDEPTDKHGSGNAATSESGTGVYADASG